MQQDQQLSNEKSLEIIHQMIGQAKSNITDNGLSWLLWGSLLFLTSLSTYIFIDIDSDNIFMGWNAFGIISILLLTYDIFKPKKKKVKTYIDDVLKWVDIGFVICVFTVILSINISVSPNVGFGFFLMIFAFLMIIKGGAIKSTALKIGALINWVGAMGIFFSTEFKLDMLIMAATILTGYMLPGLVLWLQHKKSKKIQ